MSREATKAAGNVWYEARMEAAKWNDKLSSRQGASDETGLTLEQIQNSERSWYKCMPNDIALRLAEAYNAPQLLNHYCLHECPIGCNKAISDQVVSLDRVTVKLLKSMQLDRIDDFKKRLLDIAADGQITDDEMNDMSEVVKYLDEVSISISEMKVLAQIAMRRCGDGTV